MPPITLEEMLALVAAKRVDADDDLKVVGIRSFASDETWAPMRDYPEFCEFFDSGRKLAKAEAGDAMRAQRLLDAMMKLEPSERSIGIRRSPTYSPTMPGECIPLKIMAIFCSSKMLATLTKLKWT